MERLRGIRGNSAVIDCGNPAGNLRESLSQRISHIQDTKIVGPACLLGADLLKRIHGNRVAMALISAASRVFGEEGVELIRITDIGRRHFLNVLDFTEREKSKAARIRFVIWIAAAHLEGLGRAKQNGEEFIPPSASF